MLQVLGLNNEKINLDFSNLANNKLFYDVIYNPQETNFLKREKTGNINRKWKINVCLSGFEAFKLWHGIEPKVNT